MNIHRIDLTSQDWETPAPYVRMKIYKGLDTQLRLVEFARDFVEVDWCVHGHIGYVLDGRMELDFNGMVETFKPGDGLFIPPGEKHKHKARILTKTVTLILVETVAEQEKWGDKMLSCCGLDCSKCEAYLATQADDNKMRASVAKEWSERYQADIKAEHINCDGCRSDGRKFFYCSDMCELRKCCLEKELVNCAACDMYACDKLEAFFQLAPETRAALDALRQ